MSVAGWTPMSGCGAHCLRGDQAPGVGLAVRVGRLVALLVVVLGAAVVSPVLPLLPYRWRALGIRWRVRGRLPAHKALVVANHVSWLDIVVILAAGGARLVAKSEVRG